MYLSKLTKLCTQTNI